MTSRWPCSAAIFRSIRCCALLGVVAFGGCRCEFEPPRTRNRIESGLPRRRPRPRESEIPSRPLHDASVRSLAPWIPPGDGSAGDAAFRHYALAYADALGEWRVIAWGTTVLDGSRATHRFAHLCAANGFEGHDDDGGESAFLIEQARQLWLLRWHPHGRSTCNDPGLLDATSEPAWESRTTATIEAVWGRDDENDLEEIGIRGGELVVFERRRFVSASPHGGERTPRHLVVPRAVGDGGVAPAPLVFEP